MLNETGRALFLHTWERAIQAECFEHVVVATDSDEVEEAGRAAGAEIVRTSPTPRTGSERCAEALGSMPDSIEWIVDIQGDWPEVAPADLAALVHCMRDENVPTATLAVPLEEPDKIEDPNVVKVVRDLRGDAMYFSRAVIPHKRREAAPYLRHIGVYAFDRETLLAIPDLPSSGLAEAESLEQLRFLENGITMRVLDATGCPWGIESREDYDAFVQRQSDIDRT